MSYLYGRRYQAPLDDLTRSLREVFRIACFFLFLVKVYFQELYVEPYDEINWPKQRNNISPVDLYIPHTLLMDSLNGNF